MRVLWIGLLVVGLATSAWAQPLPDYDTCTLSWTFAAFNIYQQTTPTGPAIKVGRVGPTGPLDTSINTWTFPCPSVQGTYYYSLRMLTAEGVESPSAGSVGFTIKSPPPLVLKIGGRAQVTASLLNVRPAPTTKNSCNPCPKVPKDTSGTILDGPVSADGYTWWKFDWGGWSASALGSSVFVVPVP